MNTANKITMLRVLLIPVFIVLLYTNFVYNIFINNISAALLVFIIAAITDLIDGMIARQRNQVTDFGKFMDPLADKILTFAAMLWFIEVRLMPVWLVLIIIMREFVVTGIRLIAAAKGTVIAATMSGKIKTGITVGCIITMFLIYMFQTFAPITGWLIAPSWVFLTIQWLIVVCWTLIGVATIGSGVEYYVKNREIMKMDI